MKLEFSCDDGSVYDLKFAELLDKYKLEGTFYIPVYWEHCLNGGREPINENQFLELSKRFEIGSHTKYHPLLTKIPQSEAKEEIEDSKTMLEDIIGKEVTKFCYPRGYSNTKIRQMVKDAGYTSARGVKVGRFTRSEDPFDEHTTVHVYNGRKEYSSGWLSYARNMLKMAITANEINSDEVVYHLWLHGWEVERDNLWGELDTFLGELISHRN